MDEEQFNDYIQQRYEQREAALLRAGAGDEISNTETSTSPDPVKSRGTIKTKRPDHVCGEKW